jgi:hypothetical protein
MPDSIFSCPEGITPQILSAGRIRCRDINGDSQWQEITNDLDIYALVESVVDFDPAYTTMLIGAYLVMFIVGYSAGAVIRIMKKA